MKLLTEIQLRKMIKEAYLRGEQVGYHVGFDCGVAHAKGKGVILAGTKAAEEIEQIIKEKGF